jgi:hypothetical protein
MILNRISVMNPPTLTRDFLDALKAVHSALPGQSIGTRFFDELASAYQAVLNAESEHSVSVDQLRYLAEHLQEWRSQSQKELARLVGRLPEDDPLRCPISLFGTMDYGRLETAHTRTLSWLLDPKKEHGFGSRLLEALLKRVGGRPLPAEVKDIQSELCVEQPGEGGRNCRLDVFATGDWTDSGGKRIPWSLVLEAKIDASEGEDQLCRYEDWLDTVALGENQELLRVFLTASGKHTETARQDWFLLSFEELVATFRTVCDDLRNAPGYQYLRFYLAGVLRDVCHWPIPIRLDCDDPYAVLTYLKHVVTT